MARQSPPAQNADLELNQTLDSLNFLHFLHFWYTKDWRAMELATPVDSQSKEPFAMDDQSSVSSNITYQETFDERSDIQSSGRLTPRNNLQLKDQRDLYLGERESRTYTKESMTEQQYNSTEASNIEPPRRSDQGKSLNNSALRGSYTSEQALKAYETDSTSQQQYIWTKTSNFDTSGRSPPQRIPYDEGQREHYVSEREASNYDKDGISKQQQVPTETSIVANLMPTPRNTACGRSKSPRPNVSAETKARWAILKSLAGVSKEEDVPGRETDEEKVDVTSDYEHPHQQLEGWSAENHHNSSHAQGAELETSKDDGLIPLHLGDHSNSASMERYLESLQRNPHIDDRGLQEGLRASKRLSSDYTKVQLNRTRSRGRSSAKDLVPKAMNVLGSDLSANDRNARNSRGEGSDLEHNFRAAGGTLEGDFRKDTRNAEARLHKLGDQDIASGIEHAERDVESVVHFANSELHNLDVRHDIQRGEQNLKEGVGKLEGSQVARDLRRGRHKFNADFGNAERAVESIVPDFHIGQDLRRGEQDLKEGLHKLGDATPGRDFQRGKHEFAIGLKDAETAVESILPNADILQDLQRTERNLEEGVQILEGGRSVQDLKNGTMDLVHDIKGAERVVEQLLPGHDVPQAVRRGEHELGAGIDNMVKSAVNLLPGFHIEREIRKGEHVLQDALRGEARKVENMLPGLELRRDIKIGGRGLTNGLHEGVSLVEQELDKVESVLPGHDARRDISSGERIITNGLHNGIQSADRELRRFEGTSLRKELEGNGRNLDHNLERLGRSVLSQAPKNDQVLDRDARRIGHFAEDLAKGARQFANEGFGIGENATRQAASATPNMRSSNNRDMQDREGTRNRGQFHPQDHKIRPVSSHQAPRSIMAKPGEARPPTQTQQLPPSSFPAGPQGPVSAANEAARRPMPAIQNQGRKPVPAHSQPLRSTNARPGHNQTAVRTTQPNDLLVPQQRRSEGSMKDEQFASSQAKTQGDRHQTLSNTQPSQLRQRPGLNPSKAEAPTATPPPHVAPRNIGSRHNQEALKPGHTDKQLVNRAPPQHQAGKAGGYVQQLGQEGPAHIDQRLRNSHAELRNEQQREQRMNSTEHLGDREEVLKQEQNERGGEEAQGALHQDQFPSLEQNPTLRAPHTQDQETTVPDKHEGHTANADSHQRQSNAAVNRPQSIVEPPNAVSGPRQMVNMFKARSDASIEAAGGYPGFVDQMIQLLCTMAQDALPEVERRLAENQRQAGR